MPALSRRPRIAPSHAKLFGQTLRQLRESVGKTQEELAEIVGFDKSYITKIESGVRNPPRDVTFYQQLLKMGIAEYDVALLLRYDETLVRLFNQVVEPRCVLHVEGVTIPIYADPKNVDSRRLELIKREVKEAVADSLERAKRRASRLAQPV